MKRRLLSFFLAILICCSIVPKAMCHDQTGHNADMMLVLFGSKDYLNKEKGTEVDLLKFAMYLAIDQAGKEGKYDLGQLKDNGVKKLPKFDDFALTKIFYGDHRVYTHKGWDYDYGKDDKANWKVRKNILRSTANRVFDFGFFNELFGNYCTKCDSFCALLYYVHVLGDYSEAQDGYKSSIDQLIPFAKRNASDKEPDIFWEINKHLKLLFAGQEDRREYKNLISDLNDLADDARVLFSSANKISSMTSEEYEQMLDYQKQLMDLLVDKVPILLSHEAFFSDVFLTT